MTFKKINNKMKSIKLLLTGIILLPCIAKGQNYFDGEEYSNP